MKEVTTRGSVRDNWCEASQYRGSPIDDDGDGWTLLDTGYGDSPTRAVWEMLLGGLLAGRPVRRVIGTHFHPDHVGLAGWLCERTGAELSMSRTE